MPRSETPQPERSIKLATVYRELVNREKNQEGQRTITGLADAIIASTRAVEPGVFGEEAPYLHGFVNVVGRRLEMDSFVEKYLPEDPGEIQADAERQRRQIATRVVALAVVMGAIQELSQDVLKGDPFLDDVFASITQHYPQYQGPRGGMPVSQFHPSDMNQARESLSEPNSPFLEFIEIALNNESQESVPSEDKPWFINELAIAAYLELFEYPREEDFLHQGEEGEDATGGSDEGSEPDEGLGMGSRRKPTPPGMPPREAAVPLPGGQEK